MIGIHLQDFLYLSALMIKAGIALFTGKNIYNGVQRGNKVRQIT
jgi:hypothetical protein